MTKVLGRLAIIDPVGMKAGMNYYNSSLMNSMSELGVECWIYSNYKEDLGGAVGYKQFFGSGSLDSFRAVISLGIAVFKSCLSCRQKKIDTIILHQFNTNVVTFLLYLLVRIFGFRVLTIAHDIESFTTDDFMFAKNVIYNRFSSFVSIHNEYSLKSIGKYLTEKQIEVSYIARQGHYGVYEAGGLTKQEARMKLNLNQSKTYLLFFGQIKKAKGLETLLRSVSSISGDIELIVAGKPWKTTSGEYESIVAELGIESRVTLILRYIHDDERDLLFRACDIAVLPYMEIYESAVLIMSLSYGMPVVASSLPIFEEILAASKAGELFPVGDSPKLADAINNVAGNRRYLKDCGENGKNWVNNNHNWMETARVHFEKLYG